MQRYPLRVEFVGKKSIVLFNGKKLFGVEYETFNGAGKVGV